MNVRHLVAGIDDSEAGRAAVRFAMGLAARSGGRVTILRVLPVNRREPDPGVVRQVIEALVSAERQAEPEVPVEMAWSRGVPQVEIPRFAEEVGADLIALGRKPRSRMRRIMLGDTADAVVRRSLLPTVSVPASAGPPTRVLAAYDGSARGLGVISTARDLARDARMELTAVMVEESVPVGVVIPSRSLATAALAEDVPVSVRRGAVVPEIVASIVEAGADIVACGFHPGGPLLDVETGSVSRRLLHAAPCAVFAVPI